MFVVRCDKKLGCQSLESKLDVVGLALVPLDGLIELCPRLRKGRWQLPKTRVGVRSLECTPGLKSGHSPDALLEYASCGGDRVLNLGAIFELVCIKAAGNVGREDTQMRSCQRRGALCDVAQFFAEFLVCTFAGTFQFECALWRFFCGARE